ncbi:MAG TPA: hypothetical protein H9875_04535 [Candidatus Levilactobacillus faecigallinarum]|uniref:Uncharacterized protein n=1 Tax=Candidatus Levilactobacillus faecigallinarum TaxID=2838638 RepID=A0A9D1U4P1_9LACO|nr:hypothetical protein [Candidatus Levilactobacillus faecigallinarum]
MKMKKLSLSLLLSLSMSGVLLGPGSLTMASAKSVPGLKSYQSIPKVLRGTWRAKGYKNYHNGKHNANWAYKFNKNSYAEIIRVKGEKTKTIKFPRKDISEISYQIKSKQYIIVPGFAKKNLAYAGYMGLKPVVHRGKKALALAPITGTHNTYLYKVGK